MDKTKLVDGRALILAGGDGTRLRAVTDKMAGGPRPKQFCALLGPDPLLTQTRRRVEHLIPKERTLIVVTQAHQRFYGPLLTDASPRSIVVQPANRGTAPAILHGLLRLRSQFDDTAVAIFPSDHYVGNDAAFMNYVRMAFDAVRLLSHAIVLLGAEPTEPESGYGWIECGERTDRSPLYRVRTFWEKPSPSLASALWHSACLWNTFVVVSRVSRLLSVMASALPDLYRMFEHMRDSLGTSRESECIARLYENIDSIDFSDRVLVGRAQSLSVIPLSGVEWSDVGDVERLRRVIEDRHRTSASVTDSAIANDIRSDLPPLKRDRRVAGGNLSR
ncbi:MAG TPA: sugar phosphate nucleotidyltransferase [Xanthobacteraceae bacterium]|nr:sugar phosphate nucleotidyltransferase [Xanthobacteraceae bacterium]